MMMLSGRSRTIASWVVFILIIGLIVTVIASLRTTNTKSNALSSDNLNTSSKISQVNNQDNTMGPSNSDGNYSANLSKEKTGTLTFSITDPFPTGLPSSDNSSIKSFLIRVIKIEVLSSSGHWEALNMPLPITIDLAAINNNGVANLGETTLSAEDYKEIRLYIDKASVTNSSGSVADLLIKDKGGIVRVAKDFSIQVNKNTNVIVDFNASKSYEDTKFTPFVANFLVSH